MIIQMTGSPKTPVPGQATRRMPAYSNKYTVHRPCLAVQFLSHLNQPSTSAIGRFIEKTLLNMELLMDALVAGQQYEVSPHVQDTRGHAG